MANQFIVVTRSDSVSIELLNISHIRRMWPLKDNKGTFITFVEKKLIPRGIEVIESIDEIIKQLGDCLSDYTVELLTLM